MVEPTMVRRHRTVNALHVMKIVGRGNLRGGSARGLTSLRA